MPNYCEAVMKIFVPVASRNLIGQIVAAIAHPNAPKWVEDVGMHAHWVDFERLLPRPIGLVDVSGADHREIRSIQNGKWPRGLDTPPGVAVPTDPEAVRLLHRTHRPDQAAAMDQLTHNMDTYGASSIVEWSEMRWGCRWNPEESSAPTIVDADDVDGYERFKGSVAVSWRFTVPNAAPMGYFGAVGRFCSRHGFGFSAYSTEDDGGREWDPVYDQYVTRWTHHEELEVELEEMSALDLLELNALGIRMRPDEEAAERIAKRKGTYSLFGDM